MSDIDWRIWIYDKLRNYTAFIDLVPEARIFGAGSLVGVPEKPFVVIHVGNEFREGPGLSRTTGTIWAHDDTGNFLLIDSILSEVRNALCGMGESIGWVTGPGGIACQWDNDGPDQSDQGYGTLMRSTQYQLLGRNGNA
ncbi:MAG: hypothetical protein ACRD42_05105 [Nitrososphaeraceae archaeon]